MMDGHSSYVWSQTLRDQNNTLNQYTIESSLTIIVIMDDKDHQLLMQSLRLAQSTYQGQEDFVKAEKQKQKIHRQKEQRVRDKVTEIHSTQQKERDLLEGAFMEEVSNFNAEWASINQSVKENARQEISELQEKHEFALKSFKERTEAENPIRYKPSSKLLDLIEIKEKASKTKLFADANKFQKQISETRSEEFKAYIQKRDMKIANKVIAFEQTLAKESESLKAKHMRLSNEVQKKQQKAYDKLVKKYDNLVRELKNSQKIERNRTKGKHLSCVGIQVKNYF